ncbi:MAG: tRNA (adenosine(37)-N6)-threonylcarbamoyltransferase complex ATPase subunit type 1 TsaE [Bacteroidales bacterium]|jgi:tRNA threonylcarbamoyladenosine biosynthesis protein TsaE|nr:tRNA (adenosine(37)-N6)-threonylcarbamoyltransferase complex ATPase subunit type 1 TsaE [Bacteroidales bacterium]
MHCLYITSLEEIHETVEKFLQLIGSRRIIAFNGQMAAGKTTFIKALCVRLGVQESTTSPTFALVNEYETSQHETIYHFDLYRIEHREELLDMGFEDYVYSGNFCFIEWAEIARPLLPDDTLWVTLNIDEKGQRELCF